MPPTAPTANYRTPVIGQSAPTGGLEFPLDGSGLVFDAGYPLTFPPAQPGDLGALFPTVMPHVEQIVYETVKAACSSHTIFPSDGTGLPLPAAFTVPPEVSLFKDRDGSYTIPAGKNAGKPVPPIEVVRGWPAYPGQVPAIGVAESTTTEDQGEKATQGGFVGDVFATDVLGNVLATCAYYAEPMLVTVVVELIHTNRTERDRLHDQLYRVIFPLRRLLAAQSALVRDVTIDSEKQDLPVDEQPLVIYVSVFTVTVSCEALIPTEIVPAGAITELDLTVTPTIIPEDTDGDQIDLT